MSTALMAMAGVVIVGMLLRMPIGFSMLMSGVAYLWVKGQDLGLVAEQVSNGLYNSYVLLAVPMFVFAANLMNAGTVSERIFDFCRVLVGRMRGGLAQVDILVSGGQRHLGAHHSTVHTHGDLRLGVGRFGGGLVFGWPAAGFVHDAVDDGGGALHRHPAQHAARSPRT